MAVTKVKIDDRVLEEARRVLNAPTNEEAVRTALRDVVAHRQQVPNIEDPEAPRSDHASQRSRVVNVAVYLEPDLLDLTRDRRRTSSMSYDELTRAAFASITDDQLERVFQADSYSTGVTGMPARYRRPRGAAGIQVQLRLDAEQRAWIEQKQQTVAAPSRSALIAAALRLYLTH